MVSVTILIEIISPNEDPPPPEAAIIPATIAESRLDDELEVHTKIQCVKGASLTALQIVRRARDTVVSLKLRIACIGGCGQPKRLPKKVASRLQSYVEVSQGIR